MDGFGQLGYYCNTVLYPVNTCETAVAKLEMCLVAGGLLERILVHFQRDFDLLLAVQPVYRMPRKDRTLAERHVAKVDHDFDLWK